MANGISHASRFPGAGLDWDDPQLHTWNIVIHTRGGKNAAPSINSTYWLK